MSYRLFAMAAALGSAFFGPPANATQHAEYTAVRAKTPVITLKTTDKMSDQFTARAGKVIEMDGVVSGTVAGDKYEGYLLQRSPSESGVVTAALDNPDIAVGKHIRVLARVPKNGTVLTQVAEMPLTGNAGMSQEDLAKAVPQQKDVLSTAGATLLKTVQVAPEADAPKVNRTDAVKAQAFATKIQQFNGDIDSATADTIAQNVMVSCRQYGVDSRLVFALLAQESGFNPRAVSPVGAQGLGQLMPGTARGLGVTDSFDIAQNVDATVHYLSQLMDQFGSYRSALAAYNAGPGNVQRYGGIPPFSETQHYVSTISSHYQRLQNA